MDSESTTTTSTRCSPAESTCRVPVSSLLNGGDGDSLYSGTASSISGRRAPSESIDDSLESDNESEFQDTAGSEHFPGISRDPLRDHRRQGPVAARLRKKQWTHEHVRKLQQLYKEDPRWDVIAAKLGRSAVACKLKHNKELRRKLPLQMISQPRESMHPPDRSQHLVSHVLNGLGSLQQQLEDDNNGSYHRIADMLDAISNTRRQSDSSQYSATAASRGPAESASTVDRLRQQVAWEVREMMNRQRSAFREAWSTIAQLQSRAPTSPPNMHFGVHGY